METKICTKCKKELDVNDFFVSHKKTGRRHSICRYCQREYKLKWYHDNYPKKKDHFNNRKKETAKKLQNKIIEYLSDKKCITCSENDIVTFEFDHINPKEKVLEISKMIASGYSWESVLKEIEKCNILCANCHRKKTAHQQGFYKTRPRHDGNANL